MSNARWVVVVSLFGLLFSQHVLAQELMDAPRAEARAARVVGSSVGGAAGLAAAIGVGALVTQLGRSSCSGQADELGAFGCDFGAGLMGLDVGVALAPLGIGFGSYLPHRALGGRAPRWVSAMGSLIGTGTGLATVAVTASLDASDPGMVAAAVAGGVLAVSLPVLMLELSHGRRERDAPKRPTTARTLSVGATSIPGGGVMVGVGGRL